MDLDLLDHLGAAMLLSEKLTFLGWSHTCQPCDHMWGGGYIYIILLTVCWLLQGSIESSTSCTRSSSFVLLDSC